MYTRYEDIKPKNKVEFPKLYRKANKHLSKIWGKLETAYGRPLYPKEFKQITLLHFQIKHMAENYKYLQEKLKENNPQ